MNARRTLLDRLDGMPPWRFTGTLYCIRWLVVLPLALALEQVSRTKSAGSQAINVNPIGGLILAPVLETLLECAIPYWIMRRMGWIPVNRRAWGFVAASAALMALVHSYAWPAALLPSLVTGGFLAYTYAHFASVGFRQAFLHTSVFHACINLVGCILLALSH